MEALEILTVLFLKKPNLIRDVMERLLEVINPVFMSLTQHMVYQMGTGLLFVMLIAWTRLLDIVWLISWLLVSPILLQHLAICLYILTCLELLILGTGMVYPRISSLLLLTLVR